MALPARRCSDDYNSLEKRVGVLEADMSKISTTVQDINDKIDTVVDVLTVTKSLSGFVKSYGPKAITFGAGIMTAAGIGNPAVLKFIIHFFT